MNAKWHLWRAPRGSRARMEKRKTRVGNGRKVAVRAVGKAEKEGTPLRVGRCLVVLKPCDASSFDLFYFITGPTIRITTYSVQQ